MSKIGKKRAFSPYSIFSWNNLKEIYNLITHAYQVIPAINKELENEAFKLRHKVYCTELNYEMENVQEEEHDEFDLHSTQMVVYSRAHKSYIGCVRLVHGRHDGSLRELPFEHHGKRNINHKVMNMVKESGLKYAEVSRLAIQKEYRHFGRSKTRRALGGQTKSSFALLSLYLGIYAMAKQQNIRYLFAIVEPRLLKNLHHHNIPAIQIGDSIEHRGTRVPILMDVEDFEHHIPAVIKPIYSAIRKDVTKMLQPVEDTNTDFQPLPLRQLLVESGITTLS